MELRSWGRSSVTGWRVAGIAVLALALSASLGASESSEETESARTKNSVARTIVTIPVEGMSCGSCAASIKRATKTIEGVRNVHVDLIRRQAEVEYDAARASPEEIRAAIEGLGYRTGTPVVEGKGG